MNKENLDYIKYKFQGKDSEFYSWEYEILRDNDKSIICYWELKFPIFINVFCRFS